MSLGLWILAWLSFILLISTYKWVHFLLVFLDLGYLTQNHFYSSMHLPASFIISFFNTWVMFNYINVQHFIIYSSVEEHLGHFQFLAITNKAAINIVEKVSLWWSRSTFRYMPRSSIAGSWGRTICSFLIECQIDFQSDCTSFTSTSNVGVFSSLYLASNMLLLEFLMLVIRCKGLFWFAFPWWLKTWITSLRASQSFEISLLRNLCLAEYPIS